VNKISEQLENMQNASERVEITLGDKTRVLNLNMRCWQDFCKFMGVSWEDAAGCFSGKAAIRAICTLVFCGIIANDSATGQPFSITYTRVLELATDDFDNLAKIGDAVSRSLLALSEKMAVSN
jgi:hypothetical protein